MAPKNRRERPAALPPNRNPNSGEHIPSTLRTQHLAEHLHRLGARAVHELLVELATVYGDGVLDRLEAYGRIDAGILRAVGGDRFPSSPVRRVA